MKKIIFGFILLLSKQSDAQEKINNELNTLINNSFHYFSKSKEVENNLIVAQEKLKLTEIKYVHHYQNVSLFKMKYEIIVIYEWCFSPYS